MAAKKSRKTTGPKAASKADAKRARAAERRRRRQREAEDEDEEDTDAAAASAEDEDEDEDDADADQEVDEDAEEETRDRWRDRVRADRPNRTKVSHRLSKLDEEDENEEKAGRQSKTTTEKNSARARRLREIADDGSVERNRTVTGAQNPNVGKTVAKKIKTEEVDVVATRLGYYGLARRYEGDHFTMEVPVAKSGKLKLPSWVVLEEDYEPPVDEEETSAKKKRRKAKAAVEL